MDERVKIALINILDGRDAGHIGAVDFDVFAKELRATSLTSHPPKDQLGLLLGVVFDRTAIRQFRYTGASVPIGAHFGCLKTVESLWFLLKKLSQLPRLNSAVAFDAEEKAAIQSGLNLSPDPRQCQVIARLINRWAGVGDLMLGLTHSMMWVTEVDVARGHLSRSSAGRRGLDATLMRNLLGLIQIHREPVFAFRSTPQLVKRGVQGMRPTGFDGADNERFCQDETRLGHAGSGPRGITTYMNGRDVFDIGLHELITHDLPIAGNLRCIYLGEVADDPPGTDAGYRDKLLGRRAFADVQREFGL